MQTRLTCPACGRESSPTARHPAVRCDYALRVNRRKVWHDGPICGDCVAANPSHRTWDVRCGGRTVTVSPPRGRVDAGQCEACGLRVAVRQDPRRTRFVCSNACRQRAYREPVEKTVTTCDQCGSEFPARRGARYCSSACRQQAYRNRTKA